MKPQRINTLFKYLAATSLAALALTACSGSETEAPGNPSETGQNTAIEQQSDAIFDFTEQSVRAMPTTGVKELRITIPESLENIDDQYRENKIAHDITITAAEPYERDDKRMKDCAIEVDYHLTEKAQDRIFNDAWFHDLSGQKYTEEMLQEYGVTTTDLDEQKRYRLDGKRYYGLIVGGDEQDNEDMQETGTVTSHRNLNCASSPQDGEESTIYIRSFKDDVLGDTEHVTTPEQGFHDTFAEIDVRVMANGDIHIADYELKDYTQDSNGDWIAQ